MMIHGNKLLLAYYGDDFTGSTDVMEALTSNGIPCVLFLRLPTAEDLLEFRDFRALGVAGVSRSKPPAWMDENLSSVFQHLKKLGAAIIHYKICSTFDSSPAIGSIGRAIDLGFDVFGPSFVPLVVGAPVLRRYTIFGNHFATVDGVTHRLDRHPTMSCHPVTPMAEADLVRHLRRQTSRSIALFDILALRSSESATLFGDILEKKSDIILFDVLDEASLDEIGKLIWSNLNTPQFCVGSSGLEYSLVSHWRSAGLLPQSPTVRPLGSQPNIAVLSGSCSPTTAAQISWALDHGYVGVRLDPGRLVTATTSDSEREVALTGALRALGEGRNVVLYTATGPTDPSIKSFRQSLSNLGCVETEANERLGAVLGQILRHILMKTGLRRTVIAGGDTSSYACQELELYALQMACPIAPGSPLCVAHASIPELDQLEIALKGGQIGRPDYFDAVQRGFQ
jgi:uncharacterized protein YgbK (DUF1537 family)